MEVPPLFSNRVYDPKEVYESKLLFLNSIERINQNDDPSYAEYLIPPELINVGENEVIRLTLIDFYCPYSWYNISSLNDSFTITRMSNQQHFNYTIAHGSPDICQIVEELNTQNAGIFKFVYYERTSKIKILSALNEKFYFSTMNKSFEVLGFQNPFFEFTREVLSNNIVNILRTENLYLRIPSISNHENIEFKDATFDYSFSNILAKIPIINTKPFDMVYYQSRNNNYFLKYDSSNINILRIEITDYFEERIRLNLNYNMTIKIEFLKFNDLPLYFQELKEINENLGILLTQMDRIISKK